MDKYQLSPRKARLCRIAGAVFLFLAICNVAEAFVISLWPAPVFDCKTGCRWRSDPAGMLDNDERLKVAASPEAERRLSAHVSRPIVRAGLLGVVLIGSAPFALLLLGVGAALRHLGRRSRNPLGRALPWLRRASLAAIVWAIAQPVSASLRASLLSLGTPSGGYWYITVDFADIGIGLMLAMAAYATIWALEAGIRAERELADFV
ncbi:hypothetical protein [Sphingomonas sp. SAFR-052]|uniref:hypothetical protein n=1 Tax=Sphingomonas sp. SAFR-052 TaxID=3436867 RepID=UPI003F7DE8A8